MLSYCVTLSANKFDYYTVIVTEMLSLSFLFFTDLYFTQAVCLEVRNKIAFCIF